MNYLIKMRNRDKSFGVRRKVTIWQKQHNHYKYAPKNKCKIYYTFLIHTNKQKTARKKYSEQFLCYGFY